MLWTYRKDSESPGGQQVEHEVPLCPYGIKNWWLIGLAKGMFNKSREIIILLHLLFIICETVSVVLCYVLGS